MKESSDGFFPLNAPHSLSLLLLIIFCCITDCTSDQETSTSGQTMAPPSRILVTGGAGFIGSHVVLVLLQNGYEVVVVDNCINAVSGVTPDDHPESLKRVQKLTGKQLLDYHQLDIMDCEKLDHVFKKNTKIDAVIHLAALKAVGESCQIPLRYYENNIMGTISLLKSMKKFGVAKFIFSSSATVYGVPQYLPIDELHLTGINLTNPYGKSKYMMEEILKDDVKATKGLSVISLRYFNPVGAHESGEIGEDPKGQPNNLMPFISQVAVGRRPFLSIFGNDFKTHDGTGVRDYIHIMDLADGHVSALNRILSNNNNNIDVPEDSSSFEIFNLGSGNGYSVLDMVKGFERSTGVKIPYQMTGRREGDVDAVYADASKAYRILGWKTKYTLDQMCSDTYRWQSKYPFGFRSSANDEMEENNNIRNDADVDIKRSQ